MKTLIGKLTILIATITLAACFDDPGTDIVWGDNAYLEIDNAGQPSPNVTVANPRLNNGTKYPVSIKINLMGKPQKQDVNVTFAIDAASTAIAGVHYNKLTTGTSVTIPAGENSVNVELEQLADNFVADVAGAGDDILLILKLTGGDLPLARYDSVRYKMTVTCPSALQKMYNAQTNWIDYYGVPGSSNYTVNLTVNGTTGLRYNLPDLSGGMEPIVWSNPAVAAVISDACGTIGLVSAPYAYGYFIDQPSTVSNGIITIKWRNAFDENGTTVLTPQ